MTKSHKEAVSYGAFLESVNTLLAEKQTPTIRAVRALVGGSNSTLLDYFQRWRKETLSTPIVENDAFSESFRHAIKSEIARISRIVRQGLEEQLVSEKKQSEEVRSLLKEAETSLTESEAQRRFEEEEAGRKILNLEKQLAARDEQVSELRRQLEKMEIKLQEAAKTAREMEIRAAVAESHITAAEKSSKPKQEKM